MSLSKVWIAVFAVAVVCCSATNDGDDDGVVFTNDDDGSGGAGFGGGNLLTGGSSAGGNGSDCSDAARLIYLLSDSNQLYSFNPGDSVVQLIGTLGCQTTMSPNSMAIDRDAVAWVNYVGDNGLSDNAGAIYKVSTEDASCEAAPTVTLTQGWFRVGMGFSTDGVDSQDETLFVTGINAGGALGRVDMATNSVVNIGSFSGQFAFQNAELTGTGDARLYGFFTSTPVEVALLDKLSGDVTSSTPLPTVEQPTAWAFSFWGGDFYLYTAQAGAQSRVNHYRPADGSVNTSFIANIGFRIVGAGVSTCAPLEQPK